jgi:hypothetical protein
LKEGIGTKEKANEIYAFAFSFAFAFAFAFAFGCS